MLGSSMHQLHRDKLEASVLKARDDGTNEATLDAIWLHDRGAYMR